MPGWLKVGKLIVGNLDTIIGVSKPLFTRNKDSHRAEIFTQQIDELQAATAANSEQISVLASDLKQLVTALEQSAVETATERAKARVWSVMAMTTSVIALLLGMTALFTHR